MDIIVYDFTLTKVGCLRKSTIDIIQEKLIVGQGVSNQRRTRSAAHDLESHNMVLDEDNDLIGISEDEKDQSPLYISDSSNDNL